MNSALECETGRRVTQARKSLDAREHASIVSAASGRMGARLYPTLCAKNAQRMGHPAERMGASRAACDHANMLAGFAGAGSRNAVACNGPHAHVVDKRSGSIGRRQMPQLPIEERSSLGQEEFSHSFVCQHRPVILRGGVAHWPAVKKWSPEYLRTLVAGAKVTIKSKSDYGSGGSKRHFEDKKEVDFAEVVDMMTRDDAPDLSYARQIRAWKDIAELAADVDAPGYGP